MAIFSCCAKPAAGLALVLTVLVSGCEEGGTGGSGGTPEETGIPGGAVERVSVGGSEALMWGEGSSGVVLSHGAAYDARSWAPQARMLAEQEFVALAVQDTSTQSIRAAADYLREERGAESVALVGASAGAAPVLEVGGESGSTDQIILLSGTGDVADLGGFPKLLVASEGEGLAEQVRRMAREAPGERNEALVLPGDAHAQAIFQTDQGDELLFAIVERLQRYG